MTERYPFTVKFDCGCSVDNNSDNSTDLTYCPLHSSAPELLAALEALVAIGPKQKPPEIMEGSIAARNWGLFENARAEIAKAKGVKE